MKIKKLTQTHSLLVLFTEILLTMAVSLAILIANFIVLENQGSQYTGGLATDYRYLEDRYISAFKVLTMHVRGQINRNPSFAEMLGWMQSQDEIFKEAIGTEVFDGFYMTYKGGYVRSWTYGDYSNYNVSTRPWYQQAARAGGKVTVVAPYLSYLGPDQLKEDQVIILSIAQKYSDEVTFAMDLKLKELDRLLVQRRKNYEGTKEMLLDKEGYVLSATDKKYYAHNINQPDQVFTEKLVQTLQSLQEQPERLVLKDLGDHYFFAYGTKDKEGNTFVSLVPFTEIFWKRFWWPLLLLAALVSLEIVIYRRHKKALLELSERDMRILRAMAYYFDGVYVADASTGKVEALKADKYYEKINPNSELSQDQLNKLVAERFVGEEKRQEFLETVSLANIKQRLDECNGFSSNVLMADGHWQRMYFIKSEEYELNHHFIYVTENADEDMRRLQDLGTALQAANKANLAKSEFLSRMSHEIRTPMNAILGLTTIAGKYVKQPERMQDYLEKIEAASRVLLGIINEVLDMNAIASRKMKLAQAEFDLQEVLEAIRTIYSSQCEQKGIRFSLTKQLRSGLLLGDSFRLRQILLNLVSNAFKFTPFGGAITVAVTEQQRQGEKVFLRFTVSDTGVGISETMLKRLFQPFEQESAEVAKKYGGSGLGLSITKNLVELMQGHISVWSEKDKGTTFTVDLPFISTGAQPEVQAVPQKNYDFKGRKLLVAEDNQINRMVIKEILLMANLQPEFAVNGQKAVELFQNSAPGTYGLILMDIQMPVLNGYEAAKKIRALSRADAAVIPIYAMTADAFTQDVSTALASGMNGHLAKPIDVKELYAAIAKVLKQDASD